MATKTSAEPDQLVEFLLEDFRDTSQHLRETDRKIEFTFQLFAGAFSLFTTVVISFSAFAIGNADIMKWLSDNKALMMGLAAAILILIWVFCAWLFGYSMKGIQNKVLQSNRTNFLRRRIYEHLAGKKIPTYPVFLYVNIIPLNEKIGMVDMIPEAVREIMIILPVPIFLLAYNIFDASASLTIMIVTSLIVVLIVGLLVFIITKAIRTHMLREAQNSVEEFWNSSK